MIQFKKLLDVNQVPNLQSEHIYRVIVAKFNEDYQQNKKNRCEILVSAEEIQECEDNLLWQELIKIIYENEWRIAFFVELKDKFLDIKFDSFIGETKGGFGVKIEKDIYFSMNPEIVFNVQNTSISMTRVNLKEIMANMTGCYVTVKDIELLTQENQQLKQEINQLTAENQKLKGSIEWLQKLINQTDGKQKVHFIQNPFFLGENHPNLEQATQELAKYFESALNKQTSDAVQIPQNLKEFFHQLFSQNTSK